MDRVADYLHIPAGYAPFLDGLRWSPAGEAIEYADGTTFAFAPQLARFLEGLTAEGEPIHLAFVLHLLALFGIGKGDVRGAELARAFRETGQPLRNAGVLAARLCREVPGVAQAPDFDLVCRRLGSPTLMSEFAWSQTSGRHDDAPDSAPPWSAASFESAVLRALRELSPSDIRHWLRHGRGPLDDAGVRLADVLLPAPSRTLGQALAELTQQRRIAAALPFVAQLTGALALPPRRLAHHELPMGGYADVATRGHPEQLLPSQFVLEDAPLPGEAVAPQPGALSLEFLRRYAENELLYFRREEPHARLREELVLLLDQGVRTWGDVRLVLTAGVLAFGRLAERRGLPLWLAGTSSEGHLLDPVAADPDALARLAEASDVSANPGLALERVLEERAGTGNPAATDIVLLTHPRNLGEADVAAAARRLRPGARLFAVAVDGYGDVLLAELRHGVPVKINQFHVDLSRSAEAPPPRRAPPDAPTPWLGDVEPVPFPFRFGVTAPATSQLFAFDHDGDSVLQLSHNGMLHAWRCDRSAVEILPRAFVNGAVLTSVDAVRGVVGGFVVAGRLGGELVVAYYHLARRVCSAHLLGPVGSGRWQWQYFPDLHCVTAVSTVDQGPQPIHGLDLATGAQGRHWPSPPDGEPRLARALRRTAQHEAPSPFVPIVDESLLAPGPGPCLRLDRASGQLSLEGTTPPWVPFVPLADGQPLLKGARLLFAKYQGNVLAVDCYSPDRGGQRVLRLFRGPDGAVIGELVQPPRLPGFIALSPDGRRLAREVSRSEIEVRALDEGLRVIAGTPRGKCHQALAVELADWWLTLRAGRSMHLLRWDRGVLHCAFIVGDPDRFLHQQLAATPGPRHPSSTATPGWLPAFVRYDRLRFQAAAGPLSLVAVVDSYGQVALFTPGGKLVAMVFAFRGQVAAWLPDGTRFGPAAFFGGPPTPDAARRVGSVLREAATRGKETQA
jgi:hypothetical protein